MFALRIGGKTFQVNAYEGAAQHVAEWTPFLADTASAEALPLVLCPSGTAPPDKPFDFEFRRIHLHFRSGPWGCWAAVDDSLGACEAAFQLVLETAFLPHAGLVIHASAGVLNEGAWLMPGISGTGKSTAARNGGFDSVLSDEMCILRRQNGRFWVYGTPFWSANRPFPLNAQRAPLTALIKLKQAPQINALPLAKADALSWLLRAVTLYRTTAEARTLAFITACDAAAAAHCATLEFPLEGPWTKAAHSRIFPATSQNLSTKPSPLACNGT